MTFKIFYHFQSYNNKTHNLSYSMSCRSESSQFAVNQRYFQDGISMLIPPFIYLLKNSKAISLAR